MARQTIAGQLIDILVRAGVERIYGLVGDSLNPIIDSIRRTPGIEWVSVWHEEAAAFAAGAEAQLTGRLTACAGSCAPGNLHLINGLFDAHRSMAPVLAIAAQIPSSEIGTGYFQETHPDRLFAECGHYSEMISHPVQMPRVVQTAVRHAVGQSGVAVVSLPGDIAGQEAPWGGTELGRVTERPAVCPAEREISELARLVNDAERVTLFRGSGTAGAHEEVMAFAERVKSPVGHALRGKEWIQYDDPYDVGMSGLLGDGAACEAMHEADLLYTGMCNVWAACHLTPNGRRRAIGSFTHGSMANALPQAIGAQLTDRNRQVVTLSGDGGFSMLMGDFLSLVQHDLPVKVVLFDNSSLGMVDLEMMVAGVRPHGTSVRRRRRRRRHDRSGPLEPPQHPPSVTSAPPAMNA
jgi:thiamine pyrophosphate-dependent acetolactate synthase large subunit-like protein